MSGYQISDQFRIQELLLYREGWPDEKKVTVTPFMMEFQIFEDIFSLMSARLTISDVVNLPDSFPIMGGELIDLQYRVPGKEGVQLMTWVISSVGDRAFTQDNTGYQGFTFELVTPDRWNDNQRDISYAFEGRYDEIVVKLLGTLKVKKPIKTTNAHVNQTYLAPSWTALNCCFAIRDRALGSKFEPFFFYEDMDQYNFRSVADVYGQKPYCKFTMGMAAISGVSDDNPDLMFRRAHHFEYKKGHERMVQETNGAFGSRYMLIDTVSKRCASGVLDYTASSKSIQKIDKYPTYDQGQGKRDKDELVLVRADRSHEGSGYKTMSRALLGNSKVKMIVPGDSELRVGFIVELDIWDRSLREMKNKVEQVTSGRWLVTGVKHQITRHDYYLHLELMKDSHAVDVTAMMNGENNATSKPAGITAPG